MSRYKKRRALSSSDEESIGENSRDEENGDDNEEEFRPAPNIQGIYMTSSGRIVRPMVPESKNRRGNEPETTIEFAAQYQFDEPQLRRSQLQTQQHSSPLRRIKVHDTDRTCAPDISKICNYLIAVQKTRTNSLHRLTMEEEQREKSGEPTLAKLGKAMLTNNENTEENAINGKVTEFIGWRRVEEISPTLGHWIGTKSIGFVMHGTVPKNLLETIHENGEIIEREIDRPPLPVKTPGKRGRPSKEEIERRQKAGKAEKTKPAARLIDKHTKPITVNERLQSLVDESIERRSSKKPTTGRQTNNSMAIALSPQKPSTSSLQVAAKQTSQFPSMKRVKIEVEDFTLPSDYSKDDPSRPTASSSASINVNPSIKVNTTASRSVAASITRGKHDSINSQNNGILIPETSSSTPLASMPSLSSSTKNQPKTTKIPKPGNIKLPLSAENLIRLPLFNARSFQFDVDQSPAVQQRFESVQVVDIFNKLPRHTDQYQSNPGPSTSIIDLNTTTSYAEMAAHFRTTAGVLSSTNTIVDRLVLRQGKKPHQYAQTLFCGGPIAAIAVCPRTLPNGRELVAIATFADEKSLGWPEDDENSYIQFWTINPNDLSEPAKFKFLLRVPDAPQVCSMAWCPTIIDNNSNGNVIRSSYSATSSASTNQNGIQHKSSTPQNATTGNNSSIQSQNITTTTPETANTSSEKTSNQQPQQQQQTQLPLGMLALSTNNGRIYIFSIPTQFDKLFAQFQSADFQFSQLPLIFETNPTLTLHHPQISLKTDDKNSEAETIHELELDTISLFSLEWSPFVGSKHIAAVSAYGTIHIWDIFANQTPGNLPIWTLHLRDWDGPPMALAWMEKDKICISSRNRQLRAYRLLIPTNQNTEHSTKLLFECDTSKSVGSNCFTCPLIFPGLISFNSLSFNYMGNLHQTPCYIWSIQKQKNETQQNENNTNGLTTTAVDHDDIEHICATNLSNCHQIRLSAVSICPQSGITASVGADGRFVCSLNGRMAPRDGLNRDTETFMHGRTQLQLIGHNKKNLECQRPDDEDANANRESRQQDPKPNDTDETKFCYSHEDCCAEKLLEIRLGDCALLDQANERASARRAPELCINRRLESLSAIDFSHNTVGLTVCGGDAGLVFIMPCTL